MARKRNKDGRFHSQPKLLAKLHAARLAFSELTAHLDACVTTLHPEFRDGDGAAQFGLLLARWNLLMPAAEDARRASARHFRKMVM